MLRRPKCSPLCDVRDVAEVHPKAYQLEEAANPFLRSSTRGNYSHQMICDVLRKNFPELKDRVPERTPGSGLGADFYEVDS